MSRLVPAGVLTLVVLAGCGSDPAPAPADPAFALDGDQLGVTQVGTDFPTAVAAVTAALGPPTADPAQDVVCVASEDEVAWGDLRLASSADRLAGWLSQRTDLSTSAGVSVGSTVADVLAAYGDTVVLRAATSDSGQTFATGSSGPAGLNGGLTSSAPDGTVTYLYDGVCSPP